MKLKEKEFETEIIINNKGFNGVFICGTVDEFPKVKFTVNNLIKLNINKNDQIRIIIDFKVWGGWQAKVNILYVKKKKMTFYTEYMLEVEVIFCHEVCNV